MKKVLLIITLVALGATVLFLVLTREPPYTPDTKSEELAHKHAPAAVSALKERLESDDFTLVSMEWVALMSDLYLGLPGETAWDEAYAENVNYFIVYEKDGNESYAIATYFYDKKNDPEFDVFLYETKADYHEALAYFEDELAKTEAEMYTVKQDVEAMYAENREIIESMGFDVRLLFDANQGTFPEEQLPVYFEEAS